jgi:hypothetical protein
MREPQLAAGEGKHDLPRVQVAGEDEIEDTGRDTPHDAGEVAKEDAEVRVGLDELLGVRLAPRVLARVDPDQLDPHSLELHLDRVVSKQRHAFHLLEDGSVDPLREGIAAVRKVVVPENDEAASEPLEELSQERHAPPAGDEVAGDADEVRPPLRDPRYRGLARVLTARGHAQVEVGEMRDPEPVELTRKPVEHDLEHALPQPARLEPPPRERREREDADCDREPDQQPGGLTRASYKL